MIERAPLLELDNVRARAKASGEFLRDVILSSKPKRTQPRSQGPLSTSRKYPGYGWSRVC